MLTFKQFLFEDEHKILSIIKNYRDSIESNYDKDEIPSCFQGACTHHSKELAGILKQHGYDASPTMGKFNDVSDAYVPNHWDDEVNQDIMKSYKRNGKFPALTHAWVTVKHKGKKYIADVTADQFTKNSEDRVIFSKHPDRRYVLKNRKNNVKEEFAGTGVSGVAGVGVAVGGDKSQAEPGGKKQVLKLLKRKNK